MQRSKFILLFLILLFSAVIHAQDHTYHKDIKPILQKNCVSCHRNGEVGAMPLTTYEEVASYGKMIQFVTSTRLMPPWYADPSYRHFSNERVLSEEEIRKINDWVSNDMPEGVDTNTEIISNKKEIPINRQPDLVIPMHEAFEQYGIYLDQYQVFILPTHLNEDTWVDGIEFVAGNKKIVRYASISVEASDKFDSFDSWDLRSGYYSFGGLGKVADQPFWYTWSPQQETTFYPEGAMKFLPKNSKLILHVHYGPTGRPQKDSSFVQLYFSKKKVEHQVITAPLINPYCLTHDSLYIAANTKKIFHASYTVPYDMNILCLTPQANLICRSWEIYAIIPGDTKAIKLLKIKDWNFNWKQTFHLEPPITLPKGAVIHALALYDNTVDNLCNPSDHPVPIPWGAHLFSELFFVHFEFMTNPISNSSIQLMAPVTVSNSVFTIEMNVDKQGEYELEICTTEESNCSHVMNLSLVKGNYTIDVPVDDIAEGNYLLRINDEQRHILAEQLFLKIRKNGL